MNLLDPIRRQARAYPDRPALVESGNMLTFQRLWGSTGVIAVNLLELGIGRGDCVAISGLGFMPRLLLILALARIGASSTSIQVAQPRAARDGLFKASGAVAWVASELPPDPGLAPRRIEPEPLFKRAREGVPVPAPESGLEDVVWRIALSSGTTGASKCVPWTHGQAAKLQRLSLDVYPTGPRERLLVAVDLNIGFALGHAMQHLAAGGTVVFPHSVEPQEILRALRKEEPTRILTTPAVAASMVARVKQDGTDVGEGLLSIMLGGSPLAPKLRAELERLFCPNVIVVYGSTEMGSTARKDLQTFIEHPQSAGRLLPWIEAQAVDDEGQPLPAGETGRLRFRSPAMASVYLDQPEATAAAFKDGWYYPGDMGSIGASGTLMLGGRSDDLLNLNGVKLDPAGIEAALNDHPGVAEAAATVFRRTDDRQVLALLVVQSQPDTALDEAAVLAHLTEALGTVHSRARVLAVPELPRTPAGKLARKDLPALAAAEVARLRALKGK